MSMTEPKIDELLSKVDSKYTLVMEAAKRARQINNYRIALRRSELPTARPPQVGSEAQKALSVALEEIAQDKVTYERPDDGTK